MTANRDGPETENAVEFYVGAPTAPETKELADNKVRERLALGVTALIALLATLAVSLPVLAPLQATHVKESADPLIHDLIVVWGMIIAFYFGSGGRQGS